MMPVDPKTKLNLQPLFELGFTPKVVESLIMMFLPQIQKDLMVEFQKEFTEEEKEEITERGKGLKIGSEEAGRFLAQEYQKKTGKSLEERGWERLQEYFDLIRKIVERSVARLARVGEMSETEVKKLKQLLDEQRFKEAEQLLERHNIDNDLAGKSKIMREKL